MGGFSGVYTHRKPGKKIYCRGFARFRMSAPNEPHSQMHQTNKAPNDDEAFEAVVFSTYNMPRNSTRSISMPLSKSGLPMATRPGVFKDSDGDSDEHTSKVVRRHLEKKQFDFLYK